jgi:hypothetical protein
MKVCLSLLLLIPAALAGQQRAAIPGEVVLEIRSADATRALDVLVEVNGGLFGSLGVLQPASGQVHCGPSVCTATTPAVLTLTVQQGEGHLSVPNLSPEIEVTIVAAETPQRRIVARGQSLSFHRDERGQLHIRAPQIQSRF